jgi:FG-GAP-like repeat
MRRIWLTTIGAVAVLAAFATAGPSDRKSVARYKVGFNPASVGLGDFNRDRRTDIVVTNFGGVPGATLSLTVLRGRRNGTFKPVRTIELAEQPDGIAVGRIGPGKDLDLLVGTLGDQMLRLDGRKGLGFKAPVPIAAAEWPRHPALADFNGDGRLDIAVGRQLAGDVAVRLASGGGFDPIVAYPGGTGAALLATRADGDGRLDLVTHDFLSNSIVLFRGLAGGAFAPADLLNTGLEPSAVAVADVNRDGRPDLIAGAGVPAGDATRLAILRGTETGFAAPTQVKVFGKPVSVRSIAVTRLDRDKDPDLITTGQGEGTTARRSARGGFGDHDAGRVLALRGGAGIGFRKARVTKLKGFAAHVATARFDRGKHRDAAIALQRSPGRGRAAVILNP